MGDPFQRPGLFRDLGVMSPTRRYAMETDLGREHLQEARVDDSVVEPSYARETAEAMLPGQGSLLAPMSTSVPGLSSTPTVLQVSEQQLDPTARISGEISPGTGSRQGSNGDRAPQVLELEPTTSAVFQQGIQHVLRGSERETVDAGLQDAPRTPRGPHSRLSPSLSSMERGRPSTRGRLGGTRNSSAEESRMDQMAYLMESMMARMERLEGSERSSRRTGTSYSRSARDRHSPREDNGDRSRRFSKDARFGLDPSPCHLGLPVFQQALPASNPAVTQQAWSSASSQVPSMGHYCVQNASQVFQVPQAYQAPQAAEVQTLDAQQACQAQQVAHAQVLQAQQACQAQQVAHAQVLQAQQACQAQQVAHAQVLQTQQACQAQQVAHAQVLHAQQALQAQQVVDAQAQAFRPSQVAEAQVLQTQQNLQTLQISDVTTGDLPQVTQASKTSEAHVSHVPSGPSRQIVPMSGSLATYVRQDQALTAPLPSGVSQASSLHDHTARNLTAREAGTCSPLSTTPTLAQVQQSQQGLGAAALAERGLVEGNVRSLAASSQVAPVASAAGLTGGLHGSKSKDDSSHTSFHSFRGSEVDGDPPLSKGPQHFYIGDLPFRSGPEAVLHEPQMSQDDGAYVGFSKGPSKAAGVVCPRPKIVRYPVTPGGTEIRPPPTTPPLTPTVKRSHTPPSFGPQEILGYSHEGFWMSGVPPPPPLPDFASVNTQASPVAGISPGSCMGAPIAPPPPPPRAIAGNVYTSTPTSSLPSLQPFSLHSAPASVAGAQGPPGLGLGSSASSLYAAQAYQGTQASSTPPAVAPSGAKVEEPSRYIQSLPKLEEYTPEQGAVILGDWLVTISPVVGSLSSGSAVWFASVQARVTEHYTKWLASDPVSRLSVRQAAIEDGAMWASGHQYAMLEQRMTTLLLEAIPTSVKTEVVTVRALTTVGILFLLHTRYQPAGQAEKAAILQYLVNPESPKDLSSAVKNLRRWIRLLARSSELQLASPDPSLLIKAVDRLGQPHLGDSAGSRHSDSNMGWITSHPTP